MKAEDFLKIEGFWNGKIYTNNTVYKNNKKYVIDDPENLPVKVVKEKKTSFRDVLSKLADARVSLLSYLRNYKEDNKHYTPLSADSKEWAIRHLKDEIGFLKEAIEKIEMEV